MEINSNTSKLHYLTLMQLTLTIGNKTNTFNSIIYPLSNLNIYIVKALLQYDFFTFNFKIYKNYTNNALTITNLHNYIITKNTISTLTFICTFLITLKMYFSSMEFGISITTCKCSIRKPVLTFIYSFFVPSIVSLLLL